MADSLSLSLQRMFSWSELLVLDTPEKVWERFSEASDLILNHSVLRCGEKDFRLAEIEFYLCTREKNTNGEDLHPDPFVHCDEMQLRGGHWYFHKSGRMFKSGTYKGLDIAFGCNEAFGGILIRSIQDLENNQVIEGHIDMIFVVVVVVLLFQQTIM